MENEVYNYDLYLIADIHAREISYSHYGIAVLLKVIPLDTAETNSEPCVDSIYAGDADDSSEIETAAAHMEECLLRKEECLPLLNIGQMLEILVEEKSRDSMRIFLTSSEAVCEIDKGEINGEELCDVLWEAVKTLL